ncbi:uncharacterized protein EV154DRAFT_492975 [Mucor mucedo]|uniref:uncharacterized protein n=1 Tax=Mucor mucedo TaxID=29922 RepID=UPI00222044D2|nr:uncharacterized protein EV154DRAFT_492975 [Mucor mucedo]KAI7896304.1 hypothetical protein EV154DRAFT_492975 [Mucor mucedo]
MDLSSLLNSQKETNLSLKDILELLSNPDSAVIIEKVRTSTAFIYPNQKAESFLFFDRFIQLLLSIDLEDDPFSSQYTKSIFIDAFRKCVNGLLQQHGNSWLIEFPYAITAKTWVALRKQSDVTILVCLYGLVLTAGTAAPSIEWVEAMMQFIQCNYVGIITHLWLTCCCTLEENERVNGDLAQELFLHTLDNRIKHEPAYTIDVAKKLFTILKAKDTQYLATHVDQFLGNALARPEFTKDAFTVGYLGLENGCKMQTNQYPYIAKIYMEHQTQTADLMETGNPLLNKELLESWTADKYSQAQSIRKGTLFWIQKMTTMTPSTFDMYLEKAIKQHYPADRKTVLDLLLADWTARDRFHRHLNFVADIIMSLLSKKSYNKRSAPYYAFVHLFNIPDEHHQQDTEAADASYYETKSGAFIDLSQFSNCSDQVLMNGCCRLLQRMTRGDATQHVKDWVGDCLQNANSDIVQYYVGWLAQGLNTELESKTTSSCFAPFLKVALSSCVSFSTYVVPTLLQTFSLTSLQWLLKQGDHANTILIHYFDDGPQVSKYMMVQGLFMTKPKKFIDLLLTHFREIMPGQDPKAPRSRAWFKNHFLGVILSLVGEDTTGQGVACCIFRQLFKTRDDFEWYFATPLVPVAKRINFKPLDLSNSHDIYSVKYSGLAAMLQEMVRLGDTDKKERLIKVWFDLWTSGSKFTVPVSWVLQCAGLYDQAPVLVKQMIKRFVNIGLDQQQEQEQDIMRMAPERKFLDRIMDLVLLSDTPEPDSLFELVLNVSQSQNTFEEINWAIINILVELSEEIEVEMSLTAAPERPPVKPISKRDRRRGNKKQKNLSARKLRDAMKKHEEELEKFLQETKNNAIKALTTLVQRVFNFLLRLLNNATLADDAANASLSFKQDIQHKLTIIPLFYEPLSKLARLIREPEDLQEDIQTTIDLSVDYLKKQPDTHLYETSQKILGL